MGLPGGIKWLDVGQAGSGILGGILDYFQNMEDRNYIKEQTEISNDMLVDASADIQKMLGATLPGTKNAYATLAANMANGGNSLVNRIGGNWNDLNASLMGQYATGKGDILGNQNQRMSQLGSDLGSMTSEYRKAGSDIVSGYEGRTKEGLAMLEGMGQQQKKDIEHSYSNKSQSMKSDMASRGLGGTAVGAVMDRGIERDKQDAMGRLDESLRRQKFNAYSSMSGDTLGARSDQQAGLSGLQQFGIGMQDAATAQNLAQQQSLLDKQSGLASMLGMGAIDSASNMGKWNLANQYDTQTANIGQQFALDMMPAQTGYDQIRDQISTRMGWGLPPSVPSPFTTASQVIANMRNGKGGGYGGGGSGGGAGEAALAGVGSGAGSAAGMMGMLALLGSDRRLKKNIHDTECGLSEIERLNPTEFTWKDDGRDDIGLIAQEVQKVIPKAVVPLDSGILTINYAAVVAVLINAVQELSQRVEELETATVQE
jgi:hypothetical protein